MAWRRKCDKPFPGAMPIQFAHAYMHKENWRSYSNKTDLILSGRAGRIGRECTNNRPVEKYLQLMLKVINLDKTSNLPHNASFTCRIHDDVVKLKHLSALLALCAGNSSVTGKITLTKASDAGLWFLFLFCTSTDCSAINEDAGDFETPSHSL